MRFFRIPNFTGIEGHRDDANRGSLAVVEGCIPQPTGGLRSAPVWTELLDLSDQPLSETSSNRVDMVLNDEGDKIAYISRFGAIHDIGLIRNSKGKLGGFDNFGPVLTDDTFNQRNAYFNSVGNRSLVFGDGSANALQVGINKEDYKYEPDEQIYSMEWRSFPLCKYFVVGPGKALFAAGDCNNPLSVYVSEPANLSNPDVDAPYSDFPVSKVDLLLTNATEITGLSVVNNQVIVHTDKGCTLLYTPKPGQASSGFRTEQTPSSAFSGAASHASVTNSDGPMPYWVGHDGQIYKDESATRSGEEVESESDKDQASYIAKGVWDKHHPDDLSKTFAGYDPSSGTYIIFIENPDYKTWAEANDVIIPVDPEYVCPEPDLYKERDKIITPDGQPAPEPEDPNDGEDPPDAPNDPDDVYVRPKDESADTSTPEPPQVAECETDVARTGGIAWPTPDEFEINLGDKCGEVTVAYTPQYVPDRFVFEWDGVELFDSGWCSVDPTGAGPVVELKDVKWVWTDKPLQDANGNPVTIPAEIIGEEIKVLPSTAGGTYTFDKIKSEPTKLKVKVWGPIQGTVWTVSATCPNDVCGTVTSSCRAAFMGIPGDKAFEPTGNKQDVFTESVEDVKAPKSTTGSLDVLVATAGTKVIIKDRSGTELFNKTGPFIIINSGAPDPAEWLTLFQDSNPLSHLENYGLEAVGIDNTTVNMNPWYDPAEPAAALTVSVECADNPNPKPDEPSGLDKLNSALANLTPDRGALTTTWGWRDEKILTTDFLTEFYTACGIDQYLADALTIFSQLEAWGVEQKVGAKDMVQVNGRFGIIHGQYEQTENSIILNFGPDSSSAFCDPDNPNAVVRVAGAHATYMHEAIHAAQDVIDGIGNSTLAPVLVAPSQFGIDYFNNNYTPRDPDYNRLEQEGSSGSDLVNGMTYVNEAFAAANGAITDFGVLNWLEFKETEEYAANKKNGAIYYG